MRNSFQDQEGARSRSFEKEGQIQNPRMNANSDPKKKAEPRPPLPFCGAVLLSAFLWGGASFSPSPLLRGAAVRLLFLPSGVVVGLPSWRGATPTQERKEKEGKPQDQEGRPKPTPRCEGTLQPKERSETSHPFEFGVVLLFAILRGGAAFRCRSLGWGCSLLPSLWCGVALPRPYKKITKIFSVILIEIEIVSIVLCTCMIRFCA